MNARLQNLGRRLIRAFATSPSVHPRLARLTRRGLVPPLLWRRFPAAGPFVVQVSPRHRFKYVVVPEDLIGRTLFWRGTSEWESETISLFADLAGEAGRVIDIGAHTGAYALIACAVNPRARVIAFEPVPRIFERLALNLRANGWEDRCEARCEAVSDVAGTHRLHVPHGVIPSAASMIEGSFRGLRGEFVDVPVTTVDAACRGGPPVDLIKLDVEGFEDRVLAGMPNLLAESRPDIVIECLPEGPISSVERLLAPHGYRFYHLQRHGPVAMPRIVPDATDRFRNYLCSARPATWERLASLK